ncbi:hypothetical protein HMPREF0351_11947 [Enterococcus faecium DO]|uniref:Uncharacterized protein n=1 Tax=Enterococcus faecium (strain ATCC BAA-472 / TX0016 / DO) TaxID=333849 RepID=I3U3I3_ENTFD|nr:hypothetical protein HMPREF0351_11947 [Enterococcus faecium DO]
MHNREQGNIKAEQFSGVELMKCCLSSNEGEIVVTFSMVRVGKF